MTGSPSTASPSMQRALEVGIGSLTWVLLSAPVWGAYLAPHNLVLFLLLFNVYWLYKSTSMAGAALIGYRRLISGQKVDWLTVCQGTPGWGRVRHLVVIPTYREPPEVLEVMLDHLVDQDFPRDRLSVVLAFEERDAGARDRAARLVGQFEERVDHLWVTFHPDIDGEVRGKSSNLAYSVRWAKRKLVEELGFPIEDIVVTVCDADSRLHRRFLSALTCQFLQDPDRRFRIWQPALMFYSNIWRIPAPARISAGLYSVWQLSRLVTRYKLVTQSTYSLALATCEEVGYWDVDVIPEDSRMFFKLFFALGHEREVRVEPIFLPVMADAAEGSSLVATLANHYRQTRRWAWGVSDVPYLLCRAARATDIPFWARLRRVTFYSEEHVVWPTHWFLLTIGAHLVAYQDPVGWQASGMASIAAASSWLLTACLPSVAVIAWLDRRLRPPRPGAVPVCDRVADVAVWGMLPAIGLILTALPAVDAHTRLLFGRYLHYQVTEKLPADRQYGAPHWADGAEAA